MSQSVINGLVVITTSTLCSIFLLIPCVLLEENHIQLNNHCSDSADPVSDYGNSYNKDHGKCQSDEGMKGGHRMYERRTNQELKWLKLIEEAEAQNLIEETTNTSSTFMELIRNDLRSFLSGITREMTQKAMNRGVLYRIKEHKLYRVKDCNFPARCSGVEHFLLKIINELDDMELVINVSDWPQVNYFISDKYPVFSFSKTQDYLDIMFPAWTFWEGGPALSIYPTGIGRWDNFRIKLIETSNQFPWEKKKSKGFFRGSRTSSERDPLILLSREEPDLVDAQYTKNQAWKSDKDTLGMPPAKEVPFEDHCEFKYLFNYRGVAASFRFKHLFLCKSLVFQVGNEWLEYFYPLLKPWFHFIPVDSRATKDDIKSLIQFAKSNDDKMLKIAQNGFDWINKNLRMKHIEEYWRQLLTTYGSLIKYRIVDTDGLIHIGPTKK